MCPLQKAIVMCVPHAKLMNCFLFIIKSHIPILNFISNYMCLMSIFNVSLKLILYTYVQHIYVFVLTCLFRK